MILYLATDPKVKSLVSESEDILSSELPLQSATVLTAVDPI